MSPMALSLRFLQAQPDGRLTQLAREGHEPAFEALVRRYRRELFCYCRRLMPEAASAEDMVQQALLQAWRALKAGAEVRDIRAWLYRIAHNLAVSAARRPRLVALPAETRAPVASQTDASAEIHRAVGSLPEAHRVIVSLRHFTGMSHEEIAHTLAIPTGTVRSRLSRAYERLRPLLAHLLED